MDLVGRWVGRIRVGGHPDHSSQLLLLVGDGGGEIISGGAAAAILRDGEVEIQIMPLILPDLPGHLELVFLVTDRQGGEMPLDRRALVEGGPGVAILEDVHDGAVVGRHPEGERFRGPIDILVMEHQGMGSTETETKGVHQGALLVIFGEGVHPGVDGDRGIGVQVEGLERDPVEDKFLTFHPHKVRVPCDLIEAVDIAAAQRD